MHLHEQLDDVAAYALGTLPDADAQRVRKHLRECAQCREEYGQLAPAVTTLGYAAEACASGENGPQVSPLVKARIMREIRSQQAAGSTIAGSRSKPIVWPAYLVAAACFAIALISTMANISLTGTLRQTQTQLSTVQERANTTAHRLDTERLMVADLMSDDAKRYSTEHGEVVTRGDRLYIAMNDMPMPPHGKVYQAWTMPKGGKNVMPSVTFMPNHEGDATVALPESARGVTMVAISLEPEGGSKIPTTKPMAVVELN